MSKTKKARKHKQRYEVVRPKQSKNARIKRPNDAVETKVEIRESSRKWYEPSLNVFKKVFASVVFGRLYAVLAVVVLTLTTSLWAVLGGQLHMENADQLADPFLFRDGATFEGAQFPGTHTFLLKWPLFWLIKLAGFSTLAFVVVTFAVVLLTIATLVVILYRIERRPAVFGTLCLALSSVLLLVPAVPYSGALLPVNMAMLATRNLEYVLYLLCIITIIRIDKVRDRRFFLAVFGLAILIVSDKLFLVLSAGAAAGGLLIYGLRRMRKPADGMARWLLASILAALGAIIIAYAIKASNLTGIVDSSHVNPYAFTSGAHNILVASLYALLGLFTNFGANPAYDATILRQIPENLINRMAAPVGFSYMVNAIICVAGVFAAAMIAIKSLRKRNQLQGFDTATSLSIALILSTIVALAVFIGTAHYYPVDGRYLSIALFAVFIAAADYARQYQWRRNHVVITGLVMLMSIFIAVPAAMNTYSDDRRALADIRERNNQIAAVMEGRSTHALVGDYWRVLPIQQSMKRNLKIMPLGSCTEPRDILMSIANQPDIKRDSFVYLLSLDKSLTDFPRCSFEQVVAHYGQPDASVLISGTFTQPTEELLFYNREAPHMEHEQKDQRTVTSLRPIAASKLPDTTCSKPTLMNVVAHQDDDLLFMSPDLLDAVKAGNCVRTVYITAGDAGTNRYYWLSRQQGSEAAYAKMLGRDLSWIQRTVKFGSRGYAIITSPRDNPGISLVFLNLPDGNLSGSGFGTSKYESLAKLENGSLQTIRSVDGQSVYESAQLVDALKQLMQAFRPTVIHTQATASYGDHYHDHSDHTAAGRYAERAYKEYIASLPAGIEAPGIKHYLGYPVRDYEPNVLDPALSEKWAAFLAYARYDGGVCRSLEECSQTSTYNAYIMRQYLQPGQ